MEKNYTLKYIQYEETHWWFVARRSILKSIIGKILIQQKLKSPLKILNVGPAGGTTSIMLQDFGEVKSLEFDKLLYDYCKNERKMDVDQGSITNLPYEDESFDVACAFDVIEHVKNDTKAFEELRRVLRKNGVIIITVPAYQFLWSTHDDINYHFRRYTKKRINQLALSTGLSLLYSSYFNFFLFVPILGTRLLGKLRSPSKNGNGSDFDQYKPGQLTNKIFRSIFQAERKLLYPGKFPFGVSIFCAYTKA